MDQDEWLDLVDENDVVIGRKLRSEVHAAGILNYRAINLFLQNAKGELWIPRRTAEKKLHPLALDYSCAGHVQSGDTYEGTLKKEVMEELNMDTDAYEVRILGKSTPQEGYSCFAMNYEIRTEKSPRYNPDDFIEAVWRMPEEVVQAIEAGDRAKTSLAPLIRRFYMSRPKKGT